MDATILAAILTAEEAVGRLIEVCRKQGSLYAQAPRSVAQVNRTGKWLLSATSVLKRDLNAPANKSEQAC